MSFDLTASIKIRGWLIAGRGNCSLVDAVPVELKALLTEVESALTAKLYFAAIAIALSVPDICARLELAQPPKGGNKARYTDWCDKNVTCFGTLTSVYIYRLRCGVVHEGNFDDPSSRFSRVFFVGDPSKVKGHEVTVNVEPHIEFSGVKADDLRVSRLLMLDAVRFCHQIADAARQWIAAEAQNPMVMANLAKLVRYRPEGLPPFMIGVPLIA